MKTVFAYRDAHREKVRLHEQTFGGGVVPLPERPEHKAYWDAFHRCTQAHMALIDCFQEPVTIEGAAL